MDKNYFQKVDEAAAFINKKTKIKPEVMIVLSGGLEKIVEHIEGKEAIMASDVPNFPRPTAEGHSGKMTFGKIGKISVVVCQGRFHYYEGHEMSAIVFPTFVLNKVGAKTLIVTNATGGINKDFKTGDIMMITDHINFLGYNPLIGVSTQRPENQFPDMTDAYSGRLQRIGREAAKETGLDLKEGVYIATTGPNYETKAEIRMFRGWGADTVSMSVVPEIITANFLKMETMGFSCIANPAADLHPGGMNHHEVLEAMQSMDEKLEKLLLAVLKKID